jgi:hypothetical protein
MNKFGKVILKRSENLNHIIKDNDVDAKAIGWNPVRKIKYS